MGQVAEDMIDGTCCSDCGTFFADPEKKGKLPTHGYPVLCHHCWEEWTPLQRKKANMQRSLYPDHGEE